MSVRLSNALLIAVLLALPAGTASIAATVQDWRQDLDQIAKELKSVHPNAFTITGKLSFQRQLENCSRAVIQRVGNGRRRVNPFETVRGQRKTFKKGRSKGQRMNGRANVVNEARLR